MLLYTFHTICVPYPSPGVLGESGVHTEDPVARSLSSATCLLAASRLNAANRHERLNYPHIAFVITLVITNKNLIFDRHSTRFYLDRLYFHLHLIHYKLRNSSFLLCLAVK